MRATLLKTLVLLPAALALITASCSTGSCIDDTEAKVIVSFYRAGTDDEARTADSITVYGSGMPSEKLYDNAKNSKFIGLPLDATLEKSIFVARINGVNDTITFLYENYAHLVSKECGIAFFHSLVTCTARGTVINSVSIRNGNITTSDEENVRIFF